MKGNLGLSGPRGPQGVPGHPIDNETLEKYFYPVRVLQTEMLQMKVDIQSLKLYRPAAQLYGTGERTYKKDAVVSNWVSDAGRWNSPILKGGMTYRNGYITIPMDGLYYVYTQMSANPRSDQTSCGFYVYVNDHIRFQHIVDSQQPSTSRRSVLYSGVLKTLNKGDRLCVKSKYTCFFFMYSTMSYFGVFLVV